jgi:predicted transcriptional regulator
MSVIIRIAVVCLLLAAIPFIAAAADGGNHDYGRDTSGKSGSDHSDGDSQGARDSGVKTAERDTVHADNQEKPGQKDGSATQEKKSEIPDQETRDKASNGDLADTRERLTGEKTKGTETHAKYGEEGKKLSDVNDIRSGYADYEAPVALQKTVNRNTRTGSGQRPAPILPEQVPNGEVPFTRTPALPASGLPISSVTGTMAGTSTPVRGKNKDEHEPFWNPTDSALVLSPWMLVKLWCFLGFRRVLRKNVLESEERLSLYKTIMTNPGVDLSKLTDMIGLNKETARYHLKMLAAHGKISGLIKQGIARYFPSHEMISEFEKTVIHYLWIGTTKRILLLLIETPGLTRQAIARELGVAGPSVTWQMQRLADDGLIEMRAEGRYVRYFLTPGSVEAITLNR